MTKKYTEIKWTVDMEIQLFNAICNHKPIGLSRHFQMMCIEQLMLDAGYDVTAKDIWAHLDTMYDMEALHDSEFSALKKNDCEFYLPDGEFGQLIHAKEEEVGSSSTSAASNQTKSKPPRKLSDDNVIQAAANNIYSGIGQQSHSGSTGSFKDPPSNSDRGSRSSTPASRKGRNLS